MIPKLVARMASVPARTLWLAMAAVLVLLLLESWLLVLRAPWHEYRAVRQAKQAGATQLAGSPAPAVRVQRLQSDLDALAQRLEAGSTKLSPDQLVLTVVDRLSGLARSRGVSLGGVRAGAVQRVFKFDELSFDIQASGGYQGLVDLLRDVEHGLGPLRVSRFSIKQADATEKLTMEVRLVAYRPAEAVEPGR